MPDLIPSQTAPLALAPSQPVAEPKSLVEVLEARTVEVAPADYRFRPGGALSDVERGAIIQEIAILSRRLGDLVPEDGGTVVGEVAEQAFASFKTRNARTTDETIYDGFLIALPGRSDAAVREAVRRMIRHEAGPDYSKVYVPTATEVACLAQAIETEWRVEAGRLELLLTRQEMEPRAAGAMSPEWTARMRAMNERLTRAAVLGLRKPFARREGPKVSDKGAR